MIQIYCGDGKGKTSAAVGAAIRASGCGRKVLFCQFMKGNPTGEIGILEETGSVTVLRSRKDFGFFSGMNESQKKELRMIQDTILKDTINGVLTGLSDFVILDEITHALRYEMVSKELVLKLLTLGKENRIELILTGREPEEELLDYGDYISEIKCIRHPFLKGIKAREGVEY